MLFQTWLFDPDSELEPASHGLFDPIAPKATGKVQVGSRKRESLFGCLA